MRKKQKKPKDYILASGETHSIREFVEEAFRCAKINGRWIGKDKSSVFVHSYKENQIPLVKVNPEFYRPAEVDLLIGDSTPIRKELKWKPKININQSLNFRATPISRRELTPLGQGGIARNNYGRDHHPRCFSGWLAGGGIKGGQHYGKTDDFSYNIVENPVHARDLHATMLHLLGVDHHQLTFQYQGLKQKLTGVEESRVVSEIIG